MELDFDKEIDALIRREAAGRTITISERTAMHLDADEIAAFAEGSVPDRARQTFVRHFADCDHCRRTLSHAIALQAEDISEARQGVAAPAAVVPWYRRLFLFPNLAYVMGGLVVLFAGFIGMSVLTYRSGFSEVSKVSSPPSDARPSEIAPSANTNTLSVSSANTMTNTASNAAAANMPSGEAAGIPAANSESNAASTKDVAVDRDEEQLKEVRQQPLAAAPPPPAKNEGFETDGLSVRRAEELRTASGDRGNKVEESKIAPLATPMPRGPATPKMKGPMRNDSRERNLALEAEKNRPMDRAPSADTTTTGGGRNVAGRTFVFRQGAWYDTTYRGQGTINVRRNTDDFRKLDGGLRSIAESFIGTVVVTIWNGRAYRIQ